MSIEGLVITGFFNNFKFFSFVRLLIWNKIFQGSPSVENFVNRSIESTLSLTESKKMFALNKFVVHAFLI